MASPLAGIDVGGTRIKSVLVDAGTVVAERTRRTPTDLADRFGEVIAQVLHDLATAADRPPAAVGLAVPGLVDEARGIAIWSANLGWRDLDVAAALRPHTDLPVVVGHDVRCGLLAEHRLGAIQHVDSALFVPLGTGLASALLIGGQSAHSAPWAGELGHVVVEPGGRACACGNSGCLETVASAAAIGQRWSAASGRTGDAAQVAALVAAGDPTAGRVWTQAISALADVISPIVAVAGLEAVVIGGGLVRSGEVLLDPLRRALRERLGDLMPVEVVAAELGDRAGSLGAALVAGDRSRP